MKIEIDQSGKIESTNKLTVVAFSNTKNKSIIVTSKDKKSIQLIYRKMGRRKLFIYRLFAIMIFKLIEKDANSISGIVIDTEYPGFGNLIKDFIIEIAAKNNKKIDRKIIHFSQIGKLSGAHITAYKAFRAKRADLKLDFNNFCKTEFK